MRFLRSAGLDVVWYGNFVDQGWYDDQQTVNDKTWIFPGDLARESMAHVAEAAPEADVILVNGMPNWRGPDGVPRRTLHRVAELEDLVDRPIFSADITLYWAIYRTLGIGPLGRGHGRLLDSLRAFEE